MSELLTRKNIDRDLMVLDEISEDTASLKARDWGTIITLYNVNNKPFPIPAIICSKIIERIKNGEIPNTVFKEYGISYTAFNNRYNKSKTIIEELSTLSTISDKEWEIVDTCKNDPAFLLGQDVQRASAFHFNKAVKELADISTSSQAWLEYMKVVHKEEFVNKSEDNNVQVVIKIAPGLLEAI